MSKRKKRKTKEKDKFYRKLIQDQLMVFIDYGCIADYNESAKKKREKHFVELSDEQKYELCFDVLRG